MNTPRRCPFCNKRINRGLICPNRDACERRRDEQNEATAARSQATQRANDSRRVNFWAVKA